MKAKYKYQLFIGCTLPSLIFTMICTRLIILYPEATAPIAMIGIGVNAIVVATIVRSIAIKSKADQSVKEPGMKN